MEAGGGQMVCYSKDLVVEVGEHSLACLVQA